MLKTRFHKPNITSDIIYRERIVNVLNQNSDKSIILVSAPAGYGKSMVISQWLEYQEKPYSWLSMDESFNNFPVFLDYFTEALINLRPSQSKNIKALVSASTVLSTEAIAEKLCNELSDIEQPGILVMDDYYFISNTVIHEFVNYLLNNCPTGQQIVIISRYDPPLRLSRHRLYGKLLEVRIADLIIDSNEYQSLLKLHPVESSGDSFILEWSEGWILGIIMLIKLKTIASGNVNHVSRGDLVLDMENLISEYMHRLPESFSEALLLTSICDRFNEDLLQGLFRNHLKQTVDVSKFILKLKEYNLFLIVEDDSDQWFRFHHLFGEVLRRHQSKINQNNNEGPIRFISNWFASKGYIEEAIEYALRNEDLNAATELIIRHRTEAFNAGQWWRINSWLEQLPDNLIKKNPSLLLSQVWVLENFWEHTKIQHALLLLEKLIRKGNVGNLEKSEYYFHLSFHQLIFKSAPDKALEIAKKSKALFEDSQMLGARREMVITAAMQMQGNIEQSLEAMVEIEATYNPGEIMYLRSYSTRLFLLLLSGRFIEAKQLAGRFAYVVQDTFRYMEAWSIYLTANVDFQNFQSSNCLESLKRTMEYEGAMDWRAYMDSYAGLILSLVLTNELEAAKNSLDRMKIKQKQIKGGIFSHIYVSTEMRIHWLQGDKDHALAWATEQLELQMGAVDPLFMIEVPALTRIRILITYGDHEQVQRGLQMMTLFENLVHSVHNTYHDIDILLLKALAYYRKRDQKQVKKLLQRAIDVYNIQYITRPFREFMLVAPHLLDKIEDVPLGLQNIISLKTKSNKRRRVLYQNKGYGSVELTKRELEIVKLTTEGLRNKEIADQLNISIATVKSHLTHIFQKLNVHNRTSMIQMVRDSDLNNS